MEVGRRQIMYTHVRKCKNDKITFKKMPLSGGNK
jgi:hypothetical protein